MAIRFARYHGGICFSLAVSLTFLTLIVRQRLPMQVSGPAHANTAGEEDSRLAPLDATSRGDSSEANSANVSYAEKWRAMANAFYAQHPPTDKTQTPAHSQNASSSPPPVQLASHQQVTAENKASTTVKVLTESSSPITEQNAPLTSGESASLRSALKSISDLGIGGLLAGISAAGIGLIVFNAAWPIAGRARTPQSAESYHTSSIRMHAGDSEAEGDGRELRLELPAAWVYQPRSLGESMRYGVVAASYAAIALSLYTLAQGS